MAADAHPQNHLSEAELRDPERAAERDAHDPLAAADGLEPPDIKAGLMAWIAAGTLAFILVALGGLYGVYTLLLANGGADPVHSFPAPRLETSINPRNMPAEPQPGPAPFTLRQPPVEPAGDMQRAMQTVAAKGVHAYDPLPPVASQGGSAAP